MKLLFGTLILGAAASVFAQDVPVPPAAPTAPRAAVMPVGAADVIIAGVTKNAPFTATESGETVRILPDGNRVVNSWTGTMMRNSEGRIRRDITSGQPGDGATRPLIFGTSSGSMGPGVIAVGAGDLNQVRVAKMDAENAAARVVVAQSAGSAVYMVKPSGESDETSRGLLLAKIEAANAAKGGTWTVDGAPKAALESELGAAAAVKRADDGRIQTRKESLGTRDFGNVQAEGTRVTTTIAAGTAGNDRDIEITSEVWFSKDLGVVVYSKRSDPRNGETTYQMTNIVRAEPDPSLFPGRK